MSCLPQTVDRGAGDALTTRLEEKPVLMSLYRNRAKISPRFWTRHFDGFQEGSVCGRIDLQFIVGVPVAGSRTVADLRVLSTSAVPLCAAHSRVRRFSSDIADSTTKTDLALPCQQNELKPSAASLDTKNASQPTL